MAEDQQGDTWETGSPASCGCFATPLAQLHALRELGLDSHFGEVSLLVCPECGQHWLRYYYVLESASGSGRWYLGAISAGQLASLGPEQAKTTLEGLSWYFYGGSYFAGRGGRGSGAILLNP